MTGNLILNNKKRLIFYTTWTGQIRAGDSDQQPWAGQALRNLVISSWYSVSFTTSCPSQVYTNTTAVGIDCRNGHIMAGGIVFAKNGFSQNSDIRLKKSITTITEKDSINFIRKVSPVKFQYHEEHRYSFGFIAQDILKTMSIFNLNENNCTLVSNNKYNSKESYYSLSYTELIAPTIKAVQYLDKQIEQNKQKEKELQQQILKLKSQIQLLNAKLDTLVVSHL